MNDAFTLKPGIYNLMPCEKSHGDGRIFVCTDPVRYYADADAIEMPSGCIHTAHPSRRRIAPLHGRDDVTIVRVDIDDALIDGNSIQTPYGPLTVARHYAIVPADVISRNSSPSEQYAWNWIGFELTGEKPLSVEGSTIRIGDMAIDAASMGDLEHTQLRLDGEIACWETAIKERRTAEVVREAFVAVTGDPLHAILSTMPRELDDGVLTMLTFHENQVEGIEAIGTPAANAFAREMRDQMAHGHRHIVLHAAIN